MDERSFYGKKIAQLLKEEMPHTRKLEYSFEISFSYSIIILVVHKAIIVLGSSVYLVTK